MKTWLLFVLERENDSGVVSKRHLEQMYNYGNWGKENTWSKQINHSLKQIIWHKKVKVQHFLSKPKETCNVEFPFWKCCFFSCHFFTFFPSCKNENSANKPTGMSVSILVPYLQARLTLAWEQQKVPKSPYFNLVHNNLIQTWTIFFHLELIEPLLFFAFFKLSTHPQTTGCFYSTPPKKRFV